MRKEKITHSAHDEGDWKCLCGNTWESEGFWECDDHGNALDEEVVIGPETLYFCCVCERIFDADTLEVLGMRSEKATDLVSVVRPARLLSRSAPRAITSDEFKEITKSEEFQCLWGADDAEELKGILAKDCIVKFSVNTPKYQGDLFIVQSETLDVDIPAMRIFRGRGGRLVVLQ